MVQESQPFPSPDVTTARINRRHVLNFPRTTTKKAVESRSWYKSCVGDWIPNSRYWMSRIERPATHPPRRMLTFPCKSVSKWLVLLAPLAVVVTLNPGKMATSSSMLVPLRLFDVASAMLNIVIVRRNVVLKRGFLFWRGFSTRFSRFILDFVLLGTRTPCAILNFFFYALCTYVTLRLTLSINILRFLDFSFFFFFFFFF